MKPRKVLIVDDSTSFCDHLTQLAKIIGFRARIPNSRVEFLADLHSQNPDLLLLGSSLRPGQRRAFLEIVEREKEGLPILCICKAKETMKEARIPATANVSSLPRHFNAYDLKLAINKLIEESKDFKRLHGTIIGKTPAMMELKRRILRLAKSDLTILISGESGTGKQVVARAIHDISPRADKPFVQVNSAALPQNLLESELFGFEKGAFTGALNKKPGKFERAHSGTILLDEVGEIPLPMQGKLLQVLQDSEFSALGSITSTRVDVRVLAATNTNLSQMVSQARFRPDLYYRLSVVTIHIPPLREHKEDIDLLCRHFLRKYGDRYDRDHTPLSDRTREWLYQYSWPGNIRELENIIQTITIPGADEGILKKMGNYGPVCAFRGDVAPWSGVEGRGIGRSGPTASRSLKKVRKEAARRAETEVILDTLSYTAWNRKKTAALLNISYKGLLKKIREYQIDRRPARSFDSTRSPP